MPINIIHLLGTAASEGTVFARIAMSIARGLDPARYRTQACFLGGAGPLVGVLQKAGIESTVFDLTSSGVSGLLKFANWVRRARPDLVHQHFGARRVSHTVRLTSKAKIVFHVHGLVMETAFESELQPMRITGVDAVVSPSRATAAQIAVPKARVIYTGVPIQQEPRPRPWSEEFVVGFAGRLVPIKDLPTLLEGFAEVVRQRPQARLEIAGDGPQREILVQLARQARIEKNVRFLGWVEEVAAAMARWDVFALTSVEETFPVALIEAMAAGLPVVATEVGGVPEAVVQDETGLMVPPRDKAAVAAAMVGLMDDAELRSSMGRKGWERARENFSEQRMAEEFGALYEEVLGR
jgi:glycosyltransferase involved in cell wall biosynthesis